MKTATTSWWLVRIGTRIIKYMGQRREWTAVSVGAVLVAAFYGTWSVLLHLSFHTSGWDLGVFDQVLWNTSQGRVFEYSFRDISYAGDHWQPVLFLLVPLKWVASGPLPILVVQSLAVGASIVTLYGLARSVVGGRAAALVAGAWAVNIGVAQAISYDFHPDTFAPALVFGALWAAARGRTWWFAGCAVAALALKEDMGLLVVAMCWVAWFSFGVRKPALGVAATGFLYSVVVMSFVMPHYRGDELAPIVERYGYLGDSPAGVVFGALTHPERVLERLFGDDAIRAVGVLMLGTAFLPLLKPRLWPALAVVTLPALLSDSPTQAGLAVHYMIVPAAVAFSLAVMALRDIPALMARAPRLRAGRSEVALAWLVLAVVLWGWKSPLPPSFDASWDRFEIDSHSRLSGEFVDDLPDTVPLSVQSPFVPHVSEREDIFQFPRVLDAEWVLLDEYGPIPFDDLRDGYEDCKAALPRLGFDLVREEDGLQLWRKAREADSVPEVPTWCSGQSP